MQGLLDQVYSFFPISLVISILAGLLILFYSQAPTRLRWYYVVLILLSIPYGFLVFLSSVISDFYKNSIHELNLILILAVNLLVICIISAYFKINSKIWLYSPFFLFLVSISCSFYLVYFEHP